jgi:hypothetical protein
VISKSYALTSTRQIVVAKDDQPRHVYLQIVGNATAYVGGSDVTSSNGLPYEKHTSPHTVFVPTNETLYGVCASGVTETLRVLLPDLD